MKVVRGGFIGKAANIYSEGPKLYQETDMVFVLKFHTQLDTCMLKWQGIVSGVFCLFGQCVAFQQEWSTRT